MFGKFAALVSSEDCIALIPVKRRQYSVKLSGLLTELVIGAAPPASPTANTPLLNHTNRHNKNNYKKIQKLMNLKKILKTFFF